MMTDNGIQEQHVSMSCIERGTRKEIWKRYNHIVTYPESFVSEAFESKLMLLSVFFVSTAKVSPRISAYNISIYFSQNKFV